MKKYSKSFLEVSPYRNSARSFIINPRNRRFNSSLGSYIRNIYDIRSEINNMRQKYDQLANFGVQIQSGINTNTKSKARNVPKLRLVSYTQESKLKRLKMLHKQVIKPTMKFRIKNEKVCRKFNICNTSDYMKQNMKFLQIIGVTPYVEFM